MNVEIHTQITLSAEEFEHLENASKLIYAVFMDLPANTHEETLASSAIHAIDEFLAICKHAEEVYE